MGKLTKIVKVIILLVLVAVICILGYKYYNLTQPAIADQPKYTSEIIEERISELSELTTLEYVYTNAEKYEDSKMFYKWKVPFSDKYLVVRYNGTIKYSTDVSKASTKLNGDTLKVTITHSKITNHEIDEDSWEFLDQKNGLFNSLKPKDDSDIRKNAKAKMEDRAEELRLSDQADENAIKQITQMVKGIYPELNVEIVVE